MNQTRSILYISCCCFYFSSKACNSYSDGNHGSGKSFNNSIWLSSTWFVHANSFRLHVKALFVVQCTRKFYLFGYIGNFHTNCKKWFLVFLLGGIFIFIKFLFNLEIKPHKHERNEMLNLMFGSFIQLYCTSLPKRFFGYDMEIGLAQPETGFSYIYIG